MPTFKYSAVVSSVPHEEHTGYLVLTLSCEHSIGAHVKFLKTRYKCPVCYPRERTFAQMHPGGNRNTAWDSVRQARATRTHMRTARTGKGPGY